MRPTAHHPMNREAQMAQIAKEESLARKRFRAGLLAALGGGAGLAMWLLQRIFDGLTGSESYNTAIDQVSLLLIAYAAVMVAGFIFMRGWVLKINMIMTWAIIPGVILKILTGL